MIGRTTLREIREALAVARSGEATPPPAATAEELEALARALENQTSERPTTPPAGPSAETAPPRKA